MFACLNIFIFISYNCKCYFVDAIILCECEDQHYRFSLLLNILKKLCNKKFRLKIINKLRNFKLPFGRFFKTLFSFFKFISDFVDGA